jgi:hypothetical protein
MACTQALVEAMAGGKLSLISHGRQSKLASVSLAPISCDFFLGVCLIV